MAQRYVLSSENTIQYRLKQGETGFDNLVVAGDWTYMGLLSVGCIEATTISGMLAADAITAQKRKIIGYSE